MNVTVWVHWWYNRLLHTDKSVSLVLNVTCKFKFQEVELCGQSLHCESMKAVVNVQFSATVYYKNGIHYTALLCYIIFLL